MPEAKSRLAMDAATRKCHRKALGSPEALAGAFASIEAVFGSNPLHSDSSSSDPRDECARPPDGSEPPRATNWLLKTRSPPAETRSSRREVRRWRLRHRRYGRHSLEGFAAARTRRLKLRMVARPATANATPDARS